jgi:hypothetical protein
MLGKQQHRWSIFSSSSPPHIIILVSSTGTADVFQNLGPGAAT